MPANVVVNEGRDNDKEDEEARTVWPCGHVGRGLGGATFCRHPTLSLSCKGGGVCCVGVGSCVLVCVCVLGGGVAVEDC